ncbi:MAG: hypothetical protein Q9214_006007, partial [Letrouitia sp. 1 TL-2023]
MAPIATHTTSDSFLPVYDTHNGVKKSHTYTDRADETADLLRATQDLLLPFIASADRESSDRDPVGLNGKIPNGLSKRHSGPPKHSPFANKRNVQSGLNGLDDAHPSSTSHKFAFNLIEPKELIDRLGFELPEEASGKDGLLDLLAKILKYSVNTWNPGFMHKLYATTNPIGVASELILAVLNTNLHVYKVSPALSVIERITGKKLANAFGLIGPHAGGGTHPGGSASNLAALVIARNTTFPAIRHKGNNGRNLVVFTSQDSHYSITKAAQTCGIGAKNVWTVPVDPHGRMRSDALMNLLREARLQGLEPFFVNATAGTTVLGACDPLHDVADICHKQSLWMHVDASWGGGAIFSDRHRHRLAGIERAHSITTNPHKMLGVPVTCSFLLARDMRVVWRANRFEAGYLFHEHVPDAEGKEEGEGVGEVSWDLADATLQCGRKGDSLKLALSWVYQGRAGLGRYVDAGFDNASYLAQLVREQRDLVLASPFPPPCLQVCFYHQPDGSGDVERLPPAEEVTRHTKS